MIESRMENEIGHAGSEVENMIAKHSRSFKGRE